MKKYMREQSGRVGFVGSVLIPAVLGAYGAYCVQSKYALFPQDWQWLHFKDQDAVIVGIAFISLAWLLHCHFFWARISGLWRVGLIGQGIGLLIFLPSFGYSAWRALVVLLH